MKKVTELVRELASPVVVEAGCTLWDVEYVREAGAWYLRLYLDKPGSEVDILDCEKVSRAVEPLLDEADPIEGSYTFEVSSAGAERALKRPSDFAQFMGSPVAVKLYQNRDGRKEFAGTLKSYDEQSGAVTVTVGTADMVFQKAETALVRLRVEF
ncbi:MAG: ribosome maturation factor RimP [Oscillibacter sp.]|nr:ribosome maturation factor RimP [Oscillibacter sp.]